MALCFAHLQGVRSSAEPCTFASVDGPLRRGSRTGVRVGAKGSPKSHLHRLPVSRVGARGDYLGTTLRANKPLGPDRMHVGARLRARWVVSSVGDGASARVSGGGADKGVQCDDKSKGVPVAAPPKDKIRVLFAAGGTVLPH
eukprot:2719791-Pyramimonas_sp.AAC.1